MVVFWRFLPSNAPIMLYSSSLELPKLYHPGWRLMRTEYRTCFHTLYNENNSRYWWFFLSMNQIPCTSQNTEAQTMPADVCVFGCFGRLSPAAVHSADSRFDSGLKWWIHVSSIVIYLRKNSFCCFETVANNAPNRRRVVVFDRLRAKTAPTLNTDFSLTNVHAK